MIYYYSAFHKINNKKNNLQKLHTCILKLESTFEYIYNKFRSLGDMSPMMVDLIQNMYQ